MSFIRQAQWLNPLPECHPHSLYTVQTNSKNQGTDIYLVGWCISTSPEIPSSLHFVANVDPV